METGSVDLVITDPPFGEIMQYAELSDFFYVWLRRTIGKDYPEMFIDPALKFCYAAA
jgi:adenine-specific DNA methylase